MQFLQKLRKEEALLVLRRAFPRVDPATLETCHCLFDTARALAQAHEAHVAAFGLSRGRFATLMYLATAAKGPVSPSTLAANLGVTPATITGLLDGLAAEELVSRSQDQEDRRRVLVEITRKGLDHIQEAMPAQIKRLKAVVSGLDAGEKRTLIDLLERIRQAIDAAEEA